MILLVTYVYVLIPDPLQGRKPYTLLYHKKVALQGRLWRVCVSNCSYQSGCPFRFGTVPRNGWNFDLDRDFQHAPPRFAEQAFRLTHPHADVVVPRSVLQSAEVGD